MKKNNSQPILWLWAGAIVVFLVIIAFSTQGKGPSAARKPAGIVAAPGQVAITPSQAVPGQAPVQIMAGASPGMNTGALENTYNQVGDVMNRITVSIYTRIAGQAQPQLLGSGVIIARQIVLTNSHIVQNGASLFVATSGAQPVNYPVAICKRDPVNDLIVLQVTNNVDFPSVGIFGNSDLVDRGDIVFATGNAFGTGNLMAQGMIIDNNYSYAVAGMQFNNKFRTNINIYPGSCGGPLVNIKGEVIGVNNSAGATENNYMGIGYATPINRVAALMTNTAQGAPGGAGPFIPAAFNSGNPYTLT